MNVLIYFGVKYVGLVFDGKIVDVSRRKINNFVWNVFNFNKV